MKRMSNRIFLGAIPVTFATILPIVVVSCNDNNYSTAPIPYKTVSVDKGELKNKYDELSKNVLTLEADVQNMHNIKRNAENVIRDHLQKYDDELKLFPMDVFHSLHERSIQNADLITANLLNDSLDHMVNFAVNDLYDYSVVISEYAKAYVEHYKAVTNNSDITLINQLKDKLSQFEKPYEDALNKAKITISQAEVSLKKAFDDAAAFHDEDEIKTAIEQYSAYSAKRFELQNFLSFENSVRFLIEDYEKQISNKETELSNAREALKNFVSNYGWF